MGRANNKILVIEDDQAVAASLARLLGLEGFEVELALSGSDGLVRAVEHQPDLVVLDLKLPDLHGYDVCKELRRLNRFQPLPILMLTGMNQPIDQLRGFAHGADAYLTKPCRAEELLRTIRLLLGEVSIA